MLPVSKKLSIHVSAFQNSGFGPGGLTVSPLVWSSQNLGSTNVNETDENNLHVQLAVCSKRWRTRKSWVSVYV